MIILFAFYFVPALFVWIYAYLYFKGKLSWGIPLHDKDSPGTFEVFAVIVPVFNAIVCLGIISVILTESPIFLKFKLKIDKKKLIRRFFGISAVCFFFSLMSCAPDAEPIEKYKGWVLVEKGFPYIFQNTYEDGILIKNKDSIKKVNVLLFDIQNLKPGDTIK